MEDINKHPRRVEGYEGSLKDLAKAIGSMAYDQVAAFLGELASDLESQADADLYKRGRKHLAKELYRAAEDIRNSQNDILAAWEICKPFMEET